MQGNEIRALSGLRGVAALYVVLFHFFGHNAAASGTGLLLRHGYLAVDLFFVLSGFVMALNYGRLFAEGFSLAAYRTFLIKRIGRVYPVYLVVTLLCAGLSAADPTMEGPATAWSAWTNILLVQTWGLSHSLDYPAWSISTEFAAYLLFPLLISATLGGRAARGGAVALLAGALLCGLATLPTDLLHEAGSRLGPLDIWSHATLGPVMRCLCGFTLGLCAWRLSTADVARRWAQRGAVPLCAFEAILASLPGTDAALVLLAAPLIVSLAAGPSLPARLLSSPPLEWLGTVSYSLYLVHYPVRWALSPLLLAQLEQVGAPRPGALASVLLIAASLALAALAYRFIERPGRALSRLLARPVRPAALQTHA